MGASMFIKYLSKVKNPMINIIPVLTQITSTGNMLPVELRPKTSHRKPHVKNASKAAKKPTAKRSKNVAFPEDFVSFNIDTYNALKTGARFVRVRVSVAIGSF